MTIEEIIRDWFTKHGSPCESSDSFDINNSVDEDINNLTNAELLFHISDAIEQKFNYSVMDSPQITLKKED